MPRSFDSSGEPTYGLWAQRPGFARARRPPIHRRPLREPRHPWVAGCPAAEHHLPDTSVRV
eukprot:16434131-Heterocapsa_arctica.AAC.1